MSPALPPSDSPSAPGARRERRKEARPGELLDAALDLFVEKGFAATRVEEVAARAGVSKGTLFLYFPSKEELFKAVVRESIAGRLTEWSSELDTFAGTSSEMLAYCLHSWWTHLGATKASGLTKLMMSEAGNFPDLAAFYLHEVVQPGHRLIRRILQRGMDSGEFGPLDLDYAVYAVLAPMIYITLARHSMGVCVPADSALEPERYLDSQLRILLGGLQRPPGPAGGGKRAV